jgi:choline dehydrogenase-like flavoprotein
VRITAPEAYQRTEIVVIGSGPGGSVTAATLASAGKDVMLIEEGQDLEQDSCTPFSFSEMKPNNSGIRPAERRLRRRVLRWRRQRGQQWLVSPHTCRPHGAVGTRLSG